jgi:beta-galactosidase/beta-glucuronidase
MHIRQPFIITVLFFGVGAIGREAPSQSGPSKGDVFAEIGARQADYRDRSLTAIMPPTLERRVLPMDVAGTASAFQPAAKMSTAEEVREELQRQRRRSAKYLQDLTPALPDERIRLPVDSFDWREETPQDLRDFASTLAGQGTWERVKIPHYGPPMGRAATYYRTEFGVTEAMLAKGALFVHFGGVDYKAHVLVNGALVGSHEGLFAPFEFEFTPHARLGKNVLLVKVVNDYIMLGNNAEKGFLPDAPRTQGDKIYAAVGPGWDDPEVGWHCCPPGMGIYQDVSIEARPRVFVQDIFVRPLSEDGRAEAWIEIVGCDAQPADAAIELSLFGQNFSATVFQRKIVTSPAAKKAATVTIQSGVNCYKFPLAIPQPRLWTPESPWLYQLQVRLLDGKGRALDAAKRQFGVRTFRMEYVKEPKGRMYLNGRSIKLRGANTMGAFQRCVIRKDWPQLIDDILLATMTNMNYIRLTQTPVQPEIYDYCDRLGLMLQTDLPLFGYVRRNQFHEVVRQAEEMERLVRSHPSNVMVTYINEPFPDAGGAAYRNLTRPEMTRMFEAADGAVRMVNPDRVIKAVDGDYDPPGPGMPDNHCYCAWYNGHGVDLGALHKGYWQRVKAGWVYGCGEFGAEGLDPVDLMRKHYPVSWLPQTAAEEKSWTPDQIVGAQTGEMHFAFFETPHALAEWVRRSQAHQAWATRVMAEAFRRDRRMQSFAIHLFVDAFPASWMKAIVDCQRRPKPAWFAYREALAPLAVSLRTDRRAFFAGEPIELEAWVCNDRNDVPRGAALHYQLECDGRVLQAGSAPAAVPAIDSAYQGTLRFQAPSTETRTTVTARLGLLDAAGKVLHDTSLTLDVFPREQLTLRRLYVIGNLRGKATQLAGDLGAKPVFSGPIESGDAILIDDLRAFAENQAAIARAVRGGAVAVFLELPKGSYQVAGQKVAIDARRRALHFVSRDTGHRLVDGFQSEDFKFWYNAKSDRPTALLSKPTFRAADWEPILTSFNQMAAGSKADGKGHWCICQIELAGRIAGNPVADIFARRLVARD